MSVITDKGAALLREFGVIPASLSGELLRDFLKAYAPRCPKPGCHKEIKSVIEVHRRGKYGQDYRMVRLRHHDARKKTQGGRAYCYLGRAMLERAKGL